MLGRAKRFLQTRRAVPADFEQPVGELGSVFVFILHPFKPLANRFGDSLGQAFPGESCELLSELVSIFVFNVQAHMVDILP